MPLLWDRSCTSLGGCPDGTRCAQATQSALVCDTGLIRDMVEPRLAAWTSAAMIHGRSFGADYPILYIGLLITAMLAVVRRPRIAPATTRAELTREPLFFCCCCDWQYIPALFCCRCCHRCLREELRIGQPPPPPLSLSLPPPEHPYPLPTGSGAGRRRGGGDRRSR